jgi:hypothetical protein
MPGPTLIKYVDDIVKNPLGLIWINPSAPVTIASDAGLVPVIVIDSTVMPRSAAFPNPWYLKWRMFDIDVPSTIDEFDGIDTLQDTDMSMIVQLSSDMVTWTNWQTWVLNMKEGMVGRFRYFLDLAIVPRYLQVVCQIFPKNDGTVTHAKMLMGMENFILNA